MMETEYRIAADIGGTFTDVACLSTDGVLVTAKVPSTPQDYAQGILAGVRQIADQLNLPASSFGQLLHASTIATNAILEAKGARTALITTEGFRDVLELRRIRVPRLYEPLYQKPAPLVPSVCGRKCGKGWMRAVALCRRWMSRARVMRPERWRPLG